MRILLDTHIALWVFAGSKRVESVRDEIMSKDTEVYVSVASWWELAIKIRLGKLDVQIPDLRMA